MCLSSLILCQAFRLPPQLQANALPTCRQGRLLLLRKSLCDSQSGGQLSCRSLCCRCAAPESTSKDLIIFLGAGLLCGGEGQKLGLGAGLACFWLGPASGGRDVTVLAECRQVSLCRFWRDARTKPRLGRASDRGLRRDRGRLRYCTHTMRCTDPAPEPNQLALRICTFGPTKRYSCTQIPGKARFWADLGGFCKCILGALPRYLCTETPA